jgi:hypothetical protein
MPVKKPKPKTPQQIKELIKLFLLAKSNIKLGCCLNCKIDIALYQCSIDTLLWAAGSEMKGFGKMIRRIKSKHTKPTDHQHSHSE